MRAVDLGHTRIAEYRDGLDLAPASVNRDLEVLRRAFRLGKREGLIAHVPRVEMLPVPRPHSQPSEEDEAGVSNERLREIGRQVEGYLERLGPGNQRRQK